MRSLVTLSVFIIGLFGLILWALNRFVFGYIPADVATELFGIGAMAVTVAAFFSGTKDTSDILAGLREGRRRKLLIEQFQRGPYEEAAIVSATRYYIRQYCTSIDPAREEELRNTVATREDLFELMDRFLDQGKTTEGSRLPKYLFVLADSGTGKTSFVLNYYAHNLGRPASRRHDIVLVPLGFPDPDRLIVAVRDQLGKVLFLDALDEDIEAIQDYQKRLADLVKLCAGFDRVVITCRSQFFPSDEEIPKESGFIEIGPRSLGASAHQRFRKLYLAPFDDGDVSRYLNRRFHFWEIQKRKLALAIVSQIRLLSARPMILSYIPDLVVKGKVSSNIAELYETVVESWIQRERPVVEGDLRQFSEKLAVDLIVNRVRRGSERISRDELFELSKTWNVGLQRWQMTGRSLLNRDSEGLLKFAHRSILEYLFVCQLVSGNADCMNVVLTDQMRELFVTALFPQTRDAKAEWSELLRYATVIAFDSRVAPGTGNVPASHQLPRALTKELMFLKGSSTLLTLASTATRNDWCDNLGISPIGTNTWEGGLSREQCDTLKALLLGSMSRPYGSTAVSWVDDSFQFSFMVRHPNPTKSYKLLHLAIRLDGQLGREMYEFVSAIFITQPLAGVHGITTVDWTPRDSPALRRDMWELCMQHASSGFPGVISWPQDHKMLALDIGFGIVKLRELVADWYEFGNVTRYWSHMLSTE